MALRENTKEIIRQQYLEERRALSKEQWEKSSKVISVSFLASPFYSNSHTVLTYVSSKDNEVDTLTILDCALESGRQVLVPKVLQDSKILSWIQIFNRNELLPSKYGLLEPERVEAACVPSDPHTICLTPGIAFTRAGDRLGYGGGYYDRFLANFPGISIGLAFESQLIASLPITPNDIKVNHVLTEQALYDTAETINS